MGFKINLMNNSNKSTNYSKKQEKSGILVRFLGKILSGVIEKLIIIVIIVAILVIALKIYQPNLYYLIFG